MRGPFGLMVLDGDAIDLNLNDCRGAGDCGGCDGSEHSSYGNACHLHPYHDEHCVCLIYVIAKDLSLKQYHHHYCYCYHLAHHLQHHQHHPNPYDVTCGFSLIYALQSISVDSFEHE